MIGKSKDHPENQENSWMFWFSGEILIFQRQYVCSTLDPTTYESDNVGHI